MTALLRHRSPGELSLWARGAVHIASLPVPSDHRSRYRQEFLAELYGMTPPQQLHHATGVLSRIWTLRVALTEPAGSWPRRPPWPSTGAVGSVCTIGASKRTTRASGTANADTAAPSVEQG